MLNAHRLSRSSLPFQPELSRKLRLADFCRAAQKHKQADAEDAAEEAAGDVTSPSSQDGEDLEPEPEPESEAVEQLAVALFDFPPEEADDLGCVVLSSLAAFCLPENRYVVRRLRSQRIDELLNAYRS